MRDIARHEIIDILLIQKNSIRQRFKRHYITGNILPSIFKIKPFFLPQREIIRFQSRKFFQETTISVEKVKRDE